MVSFMLLGHECLAMPPSWPLMDGPLDHQVLDPRPIADFPLTEARKSLAMGQ